ncbi:uncharacterized protein [Aegilops tauschii subsp. strangulata]|uniref:uncharacterized protein n=1 Tax=Aegilops tauschii subsp. strangulata TaxID=200361 RepID=UPI001E1CAC63|nr:uncharacterized protein LOC123493874 [Aegilops tauschii subsp. strangulata]
MESKHFKSVIMCALILGLVPGQIQVVEGKSCCKGNSSRNCYNVCRLRASSAASSERPSQAIFSRQCRKIGPVAPPGARFLPAWAEISAGGPKSNPPRWGAGASGFGAKEPRARRVSDTARRLPPNASVSRGESMARLPPVSLIIDSSRAARRRLPSLARVHTGAVRLYKQVASLASGHTSPSPSRRALPLPSAAVEPSLSRWPIDSPEMRRRPTASAAARSANRSLGSCSRQTSRRRRTCASGRRGGDSATGERPFPRCPTPWRNRPTSPTRSRSCAPLSPTPNSPSPSTPPTTKRRGRHTSSAGNSRGWRPPTARRWWPA